MHFEKIQLFRKVLRTFERDVVIRQKRDDRTGGLSVVQCHTVINLGDAGTATIGQMAERMGVDKSTLSRTMDGLVEKKLVTRTPHPEDRRSLLVSLTLKGQQICDQLNRVNNDYIKRVFSRIPETEHEAVIRYFQLFVSAMSGDHRN